ncbi:MAG: hydroxyisourate hydrolase [Gemmatimonadaceae bacterium]|uniref:hydroxyisourate hydrolase n=1 Tax=Caulobacter sp. DWP3-1-3b2 TaxID=2804643 RepID=UPI001988E0EE|nr:hydroxyisourate hydrolase [Caulobacter sp.]
MSGLTTHILDTAAGRPAAGVVVRVSAHRGGELALLGEMRTDADGRARLVEGADLVAGGYRLEFSAGDYFKASGATVSDPPFLDVVVIDFNVADPEQHHHVPLLVSPFAYSTYRGS